MKTLLTERMRQYGQKVMVIPSGPGQVRLATAFLQPILKKREDLPVAATPLGAVSEQRWLYIGPAGITLSPGDRIRSAELYLIVQEVLTVNLGRDAMYRRAILRREKEGPL